MRSISWASRGHGPPGIRARPGRRFVSAGLAQRGVAGARRAAPPSKNSVGVVATPARTPARKSSRTRSGDRVRAAVGVEAGEVEPEPLGARPQVRVLEAALVGEQGVVEGPERVLAARPPRPRRRRPARAGGSSARGSGGTRRAAPARAGAASTRGAERALVVAVDDHQRARPPAPARGRAGPIGAAGRSRGRSGPRRGERVEDQVGAGQVARRGRLVAPLARRRRGRSARARAAGSRPGAGRRTRGTRRPWARSPTAARSSMPSCSRNAVCEYVASQETP